MKRVILFDGVCNLCNASVNFIIDHDSQKKFHFASLQSVFAKDILTNPYYNFHLYKRSGLTPLDDRIQQELMSLNSIVYLEDKVLYQKSEAAIRIATHLDGYIRFASIAKILPIYFRDSIYEYIARNRYKWFGKSESCRMPRKDLMERFLE